MKKITALLCFTVLCLTLAPGISIAQEGQTFNEPFISEIENQNSCLTREEVDLLISNEINNFVGAYQSGATSANNGNPAGMTGTTTSYARSGCTCTVREQNLGLLGLTAGEYLTNRSVDIYYKPGKTQKLYELHNQSGCENANAGPAGCNLIVCTGNITIKKGDKTRTIAYNGTCAKM